jgi:alpha-tubulin suppressor-like RCC1 family protein
MPVSGDLRWASLSVGAGHTCGLTTDGTAYCWGNGERGRFGTGDTSIALSPKLIADTGTYVAITAGGYHTCALTATGTAFCWGQGKYGQLGDGIFADRLRPVQVAAYQ